MQTVLATEEGHRCFLEATPQGVTLVVVPATPPLEDALDVFQLGMHFTSVIQVLGCLRAGETYVSADGRSSISIDRGRCRLSFQYRHDPSNSFVCHLPAESATRLVAFLKGTLEDPGGPTPVPRNRLGRNDPCPCGSGNKYKRCCMRKEAAAGRLPPDLATLQGIGDPALDIVLDLARANPAMLGDPAYWNELGVVLSSAQRFAQAEPCFERALRIDPSHHEATVNFAVVIGQQGDLDAALRRLTTVPDGYPRKAVIRANILQDLGRHAEAIPLYEAAIEEEPGFFLPYARILNSLRQTQSPLFEHWLRRGIGAVPTSAAIANAYCLHLLRQDQLQELAAADWIDHLESEAGRIDMAGRSADDPQLIVEAQLFRRAALIMRSDSRAELREAVRILRATDRRWHLCDVGRVLAVLAADLGEPDLVEPAYERVCPHCRQIARKIPSRLEPLLAYAHLCAGDAMKAATLCETVLRESPDDLSALRHYWEALDKLGRAAEAIDAAQRLHRVREDEPDLPYHIGSLCAKVGRFGTAADYFAEQIRRVPYHGRATESAAFLDLLRGDLPRARERWEAYRGGFLGVHGARGDEERWLLGADGFIEVGAYLRVRTEKFERLVSQANATLGSPTYAHDLNRANDATEPRLGVPLTLKTRPYSLEDLLTTLRLPGSDHRPDVEFQVAMQQRGDFSLIAAHLEEELPRWTGWPEEARRSLLEGERRIREPAGADHSPEVVCFAKAVEIVLKRLVFDSYKERARVHEDFEAQLEAGRSGKFPQAEVFLRYLDKSPHIELGSMGHVLRLCAGRRTARDLPVIARLRDYIANDLTLAGLLEKEALADIGTLVDAHRNPAAHSEACDLESARTARKLAVRILRLF